MAYDSSDAVSSPKFVTGTPTWIQPLIEQAARKHNIPSVLLSALLKQESGFNPNLTSSAGAVGIAQMMPSTAAGMGVDPMNTEQAVDGAARHLGDSLVKYGGDVKKSLAAYNAGGNAVDKFGGVPPYPETQRYVKNIIDMTGNIHQSGNQPLLEAANDAKKQATQTDSIGASKIPNFQNGRTRIYNADGSPYSGYNNQAAQQGQAYKDQQQQTQMNQQGANTASNWPGYQQAQTNGGMKIPQNTAPDFGPIIHGIGDVLGGAAHGFGSWVGSLMGGK